MEAATPTDREKEDEEETTKPTALDFLFNEERQVENWKKQLDIYISEPEIGHNLGPLLWWKTHMDKYCTMKSLVQKYLSIPTTSASSERTFSSAGNIVTAKRSCLLPENVKILTFLYQNRRLMM